MLLKSLSDRFRHLNSRMEETKIHYGLQHPDAFIYRKKLDEIQQIINLIKYTQPEKER